MASLYQRARSPYLWLKFRAATGPARVSTGFRRDLPADIRKARALCAARTSEELACPSAPPAVRWASWVPTFLATRHGGSPKSLARYRIVWQNLEAFLTDRHITSPGRLTFADCFDYLPWRTAGNKRLGIYRAARNTAIWELSLLARLMDHAIRNGWATSNPARRLGLRRSAPHQKPEITDAHLDLIWRRLQVEPAWMRVSFQIGLYTGCRLGETSIPMRDVDLVNQTITFACPKGGTSKAFVAPIHPQLLPLFRELRRMRRAFTCQLPALASRCWWRFFKKSGLPQYSFHCLRVSFVSRACRAGLQERDAMSLVNHASATVHRVYQRFRASDLAGPLRQIALPALAEIADEKPTTA